MERMMEYMLAERAESVRRRIAETLYGEPSTIRADIDRLEHGLSRRAVRVAARMSRLRDALRSDRLRPDPARLERLRRRTDRAAGLAALLERVVGAAWSVRSAERRLEECESELLDLELTGIDWPAAAWRRIAIARAELAAATLDLAAADPAGRYRTRGSELDRAAAAARMACSRASGIVGPLAGIVSDLDGWPAGPDPDWLGPALAELASVPETMIGEVLR